MGNGSRLIQLPVLEELAVERDPGIQYVTEVEDARHREQVLPGFVRVVQRTARRDDADEGEHDEGGDEGASLESVFVVHIQSV